MGIIASLARGALAGAVGTLSMDFVRYRRYRRGGGEDGFWAWESAAGTSTYDEAGAPAQVGKLVVETVTGSAPPDDSAGLMTNVVHWATGIGWGVNHGAMAATVSSASPVLGLLTGIGSWATGYAVLAPVGIYKPFSEYDTETLWKDLSAHLVFGAVTGLTYALLDSD